MKCTTLCCLLWITVAPASADSETVESEVWDQLIRWCETESYIPYTNPLSDESWREELELPESAARLLRRARRCQHRVRREIPGAIRQCRADWKDNPAWSADDRHRISAGLLEHHCPGQFHDLWTRYNDCCAVIPGY